MGDPDTTLQIRRAEPRDDEPLGDLLIDSFLQAYARELPWVTYGEERRHELRDCATKREEGVVFVAELDGELAGTVLVYPPGAPHSEAWLPNTADLRQLAVAPKFFGRGLSKPLLDTAEAAAWAMGVERVSLHVRRQATGVCRMYEGRGYVRTPEGDLTFPEVELAAFVLTKPS
jgi:ribosomal protein S18 acetylase RimI-like enzyme